MKKWGLVILLITGLVVVPTQKSHAIWWVVVKAAVKKVIKAIDLQIQRQQNKVIWLQNAQKTIENAMSKIKLGEIADWTERQRTIYQKYFEELHKVKTLISYYQRIKAIIEKQTRLVAAYKSAWQMIRQDKNFSAEEIEYIGRVYEGILNETIKNVDQLAMVANSFQTQMSDAKRLEIIAQVDQRVEENYNDLMKFNSENALLSLSRSRGISEIEMVKRMYGLESSYVLP